MSLSILLIEDNHVDIEAVVRATRGWCDVTARTTCAEGLRVAETERFDCILLDLSLPDSSGMETVESICGALRDVPIIVLTGLNDPKMGARLLKAGAQDYIPKAELGRVVLLRSIRHAIERHKILCELKATQDHLIQAQRMEAVGQLAGGIAHDFNNYLQIIRLYGDLVRESLPDDHERAADMDQLLRGCAQAAEVVDQLLTFAKQKPSLQQSVSVRALVEEAAPMLRRALGSSSQLQLDLSEADCTVSIEPGRLNQVLLNLVVNARDAMPDGGTVTLSVQAVADTVTVTVTDSGVGMDARTLARALEPFYSTKGTHGTGLGLSMCFGIIDQAGGTLAIQSREGAGTAITLTFPRQVSAGAARADGDRGTSRGGRGHILLVEDVAMLRRSLSRGLSRHGYTVTEAEDGQVALDRLREGRFDLILTDMTMPVLDGHRLIARLSVEQPDLPIVQMTGYLKPGHTVSAHPHILKPFELSELLDLIEDRLARRSA